jgi:3-oxoacyl-[acyl-carrier-protein] synthase III
MADATTTILESIGVYLPANAVATDEVLRGCKRPVRFPLEQLTGIRSRRMAGEGEYSFELARNAVAECLANSSKTAQEIELLVCCNISRYDAPLRASYEPCAAVLLKKHFSLARAMCFDINNACAGMFTGLYLIDALIKAGLIRCGMAVSGEYITHLTRTAQMEIAGYMDPQLACLTLGDAGAAAILEASSREGAGWHAIDLYTIAKYSPLCIAKPTQQEHGGAVMSTASITATAAVVERSAMHAVNTMLQAQRPLETIQHIIPHQTSRTTLQEGLSEIARLFDRDLGPLLINNLAERGNTASNTHFVALCDQIERGRIRSGDSLMFCISGSGMTIGTAIHARRSARPACARPIGASTQRPCVRAGRGPGVVLSRPPAAAACGIGGCGDRR